MRKWLITAAFLLLITIFGALMTVWAGFRFFTAVSCLLLAAYWCGELIYNYIVEYKLKYQEKYQYFVAIKINTSNLTLEDISRNKDVYIKKFNKSLRKEKCFEILKISLALGIMIAMIVLLFK